MRIDHDKCQIDTEHVLWVHFLILELINPPFRRVLGSVTLLLSVSLAQSFSFLFRGFGYIWVFHITLRTSDRKTGTFKKNIPSGPCILDYRSNHLTWHDWISKNKSLFHRFSNVFTWDEYDCVNLLGQLSAAWLSSMKVQYILEFWTIWQFHQT